MSPSLAVVASNPGVTSNPGLDTAPAETIAQHVRRLQSEARALAVKHIQALEAAIDEMGRLASEVAGGGEAYPVGARELARQMLGDYEARRRALDAIVARTALS